MSFTKSLNIVIEKLKITAPVPIDDLQDFDIVLANPNRIDDFINSLQHDPWTEEEVAIVMGIILGSIDEAIKSTESFDRVRIDNYVNVLAESWKNNRSLAAQSLYDYWKNLPEEFYGGEVARRVSKIVE